MPAPADRGRIRRSAGRCRNSDRDGGAGCLPPESPRSGARILRIEPVEARVIDRAVLGVAQVFAVLGLELDQISQRQGTVHGNDVGGTGPEVFGQP